MRRMYGVEWQSKSQSTLDFVERHFGVHMCNRAGSDQVVHGAGDQDLRLRRAQLGIGQRDLVFLYSERQLDVHVEGWIAAGPEIQRGDIDFAAVAGSPRVGCQSSAQA